MKIKKIKTEFKKNGFIHKLMKRVGNIALLEQRNSGGSTLGYEVHKVRCLTIRGDQGGDDKLLDEGYTHKEKSPSNEQFGMYGWS